MHEYENVQKELHEWFETCQELPLCNENKEVFSNNEKIKRKSYTKDSKMRGKVLKLEKNSKIIFLRYVLLYIFYKFFLMYLKFFVLK